MNPAEMPLAMEYTKGMLAMVMKALNAVGTARQGGEETTGERGQAHKKPSRLRVTMLQAQ